MSRISTYPMKSSTILRVAYDRAKIDTDPDYQRRSDIWNEDKRQLLIDSILNEYDIPKLYFHALTTPRKMSDGREVNYAIIDGKQRVETIWGFIDDKFRLADDFVYYDDPSIKAAGLTYSEITQKYPSLKVIFDSFILPIILVETDDIDLIEDMFSRLNEAVPLNAAEKRNAIGGPMARTIREISEHPFFMQNAKVTNKRYQHREIAARLLFLEDSLNKNRVIDTKKIYLDNFVRLYKVNSSLDASRVANGVKKILNEMHHIFQDKDSLLSSQADIPIYYLVIRIALKFGRLPDVNRAKIEEFETKVYQNRIQASVDFQKTDFDLLTYDRLSIQGTNDASSIRERLRIITTFLGLPDTLLTSPSAK